MTELFQAVARGVGETIQRPVASHTNGRYMVVTVSREEAPAAGNGRARW
jgi:hypothetical protein